MEHDEINLKFKNGRARARGCGHATIVKF